MRRIALILALLAFLVGSAGCFCYDCCDYLHPHACPRMPECNGCLPCNQRPDYSERGNYPG